MFDKIGLLVIKLLVLGPIRVELGKEVDQLLLVAQQDVQDGLGLVRIGHKHFKNVEGFKLDVARFFLQHVHHQLQVIRIGNVPGHHLE